MAMKAPLRNCFQKWWGDIQSSKTKIRLMGEAAMASMASPTVKCKSLITVKMIMMRAVKRQTVWKVSVNTSVPMPPRRV